MPQPPDEENTPLLLPPPTQRSYESDDDEDDDRQQIVPRQSLRKRTARFLASKPGHCSVLALVTLEIASILATLIVRLFACEGRFSSKPSLRVEHALDIVEFGFSCLFMVELAVRVWAFGRAFFRSWFARLDGVVVILGLAISVLLKGVLREIAALVVVVRLLRVFRIMDEANAGAEERMAGLKEQIAFLFGENESLRGEVRSLRAK